MKEAHVAVKPSRSAKQQALETVPKLRERFPIERAQMQVILKIIIELMDKKINIKVLIQLTLKNTIDSIFKKNVIGSF